MLVKIDHICCTCRTGEEEEVLKSFPEYSVSFVEKNLTNLDIKEEKSNYENTVHDIIYLEAENHVPIEITSYHNVGESGNGISFSQEDSVLHIKTPDVSKTLEVLKLCGAKVTECRDFCAECSLKGLLDKNQLRIEVSSTKENTNWILDEKGICCLAIIVRNIETARDKWMKYYRATEIRSLNVNGRVLKLFFGYGDCGETIEIISY